MSWLWRLYMRAATSGHKEDAPEEQQSIWTKPIIAAPKMTAPEIVTAADYYTRKTYRQVWSLQLAMMVGFALVFVFGWRGHL